MLSSTQPPPEAVPWRPTTRHRIGRRRGEKEEEPDRGTVTKQNNTTPHSPSFAPHALEVLICATSH